MMLFGLMTMANLVVSASQQCEEPKVVLGEGHIEKEVYRVGVLAVRGQESAVNAWSTTFNTYLTETAGKRMDPPVRFEMAALAVNEGALDKLVTTDFDFVYANPTIASCLESEIGVSHILTSINKFVAATGEKTELTKFGGLIIAKNNRDDIQTIHDVKGKRVACVSLEGLGAAQMQFRELQQAGLHHIQDPKQLIFYGNQNKIVNAVISGAADVGFIRTGQLEKTTDDETGELVDRSQFKIIGLKETTTLSNGKTFPFNSSTILYPEWSLGKYPHVPEDVATEVSRSLLAMSKHSALAPALRECFEVQNCEIVAEDSTPRPSLLAGECASRCLLDLDTALFQQCDTTAADAILASNALSDGNYVGWQTALSYMEIRNMQEETGFIKRDQSTGSFKCLRSSKLADSFSCPPGHFKKDPSGIRNGCESEGFDCFGYQCLCSPCIDAFEVDFFHTQTTLMEGSQPQETKRGCSKFSFCGQVKQGSQLRFVAIDNLERVNATFEVNVLIGSAKNRFQMTQNLLALKQYDFEFDASLQQVGVVIMEVLVNGEQIPESPFRVQIDPKDCRDETGDYRRVPDVVGICVCDQSSVEILDKCVSIAVIVAVVLIPMVLLAIGCSYSYAQKKRKEADMIWKVSPDELLFADPPKVLGRGTFGFVLGAEYRGTQVAVKRVLPAVEIVSTTISTDSRGLLLNLFRRCFSTAPTLPLHEVDCDSSPSRDVEDGASISRSAMVGASIGRSSAKFNLQYAKRRQFFDSISWDHGSLSARCSKSLPESPIIRGLSGYESGYPLPKYNSHENCASQNTRIISSAKYRQLQQEFVDEMRLLSQLRHPCITTVMGGVLSRTCEPMLVMECMELGSLYDILHNESMFLENEVMLSILRDIAQGVRFLHAANPQVIHGDLKSKNVLLDAKFKAKVADFGLSQRKHHKQKATGTPFWMAPELLRGETSSTDASDMYAFGILLYEVFSRKDPYEGEDVGSVLEMVADPEAFKRPRLPESCPPVAVRLLDTCVVDEALKRPTAEDVDDQLRMLEAAVAADPGLRTSTERTEALLLDMFPKNVALALREGRKVEPESFESVTVFFADIVGYTNISSTLPAMKVSNLLDRLYTKLDHLCDLHHVFKVETVGDAFMACTNLASEQPSHAHIIAEFAFAAMHAAAHTVIDEDNPSRGHIKLRVGVHSGPVVGHVTGSRNPRYSLIGDTVNTASRMESHSMPGRVQCSEETANLLREQRGDVDLVPRGNIPVKGKGMMQTFWVRSLAGSVTALSSNSMHSSSIEGSDAFKQYDPETRLLLNVATETIVRALENVAALRTNKPCDVGARDKISIREEEISRRLDFSSEKTGQFQIPSISSLQAAARHNPVSRAGHFSNQSIIDEINAYMSFICELCSLHSVHNFDRAVQAMLRAKEMMDAVKSLEFVLQNDPLLQFSVLLSTLLQHVNTQGLNKKSMASSHLDLSDAVDELSESSQHYTITVGWERLHSSSFDEFRGAIYGTEQELERFRHYFVNFILASDPETPFAGKPSNPGDIIRCILQTSSIFYCTGSWGAYQQWNRRLYDEELKEHADQNLPPHSAEAWYNKSIVFLECVALPLAERCESFGLSDPLIHAKKILRFWTASGKKKAQSYIYGNDDDPRK